MPHPCAMDETLEGCAELAATHALEAVPVDTAISLKEAFIANAPAITEQLNQAMLKVGKWVEATEDFAVVQTPLLVEEIVWWGIASPGFWVALGIILMLANPVVRFSLGKSKELKDFGNPVFAALDEKGATGSWIMAAVGAIVLPVVGFFCVAVNAMAMLKPMIAPRLYLVEYFQQLIK